ncbi:MAG: hypothetical protein HY298_11165 [Verrucomicrobia bacterium]|nr:hypothetical protein [Verrucomicrobiota bacterium]
MGFLSQIFKPPAAPLLRLPSGSFTLDREGRIIISTVAQSYPVSFLQEIGDQVLAAFNSAQAAQLPLSELIVHFSSLTVTARELRGGAVVFLSPPEVAAPQN